MRINWGKNSSHITQSLTCLLLLAMIGCNAGSGSIKGTVNTKEGADANSGINKPASNPTEVYTGSTGPATGSVGGVSGVTNPQAPAVAPGPIDSPVKAPTQITGAYLYCYAEKDEATSALGLCSMRDKDEKPVNIGDTHSNLQWIAGISDKDATVKVTSLVAQKGYWHAKLAFSNYRKGFRPDMKNISVTFKGTNIATNVEVQDVKKIMPKDTGRAMISLRSSKVYPIARCMFYTPDGAPDYKQMLFSCDLANRDTAYYFNEDNRLLHSSDNRCLSYDTGTPRNYFVPKDCGDTNYANLRWEFRGKTLRVQNGTLCLAIVAAANQESDYAGLATCGAGLEQQWDIVPHQGF